MLKAMEWYYVEAGQRVGPAAPAQFDELLRNGKITPETLVWNESMTEWRRYGEIAAAGAAPLTPAGPTQSTAVAVCAECGGSFSRDEMMPDQDSYVCAQCKPIF